MASPTDHPPWRQEGSKVDKWQFHHRVPRSYAGLQRGREQVERGCQNNRVLVSRCLGALTLD